MSWIDLSCLDDVPAFRVLVKLRRSTLPRTGNPSLLIRLLLKVPYRRPHATLDSIQPCQLCCKSKSHPCSCGLYAVLTTIELLGRSFPYCVEPQNSCSPFPEIPPFLKTLKDSTESFRCSQHWHTTRHSLLLGLGSVFNPSPQLQPGHLVHRNRHHVVKTHSSVPSRCHGHPRRHSKHHHLLGPLLANGTGQDRWPRHSRYVQSSSANNVASLTA